MSFGMRIWGAGGALQLDENSFTVRIVYSVVVQRIAGENRSRFISIPGVTPDKCAAICLPNTGSWSGSSSGQDASVSQYDAQVVADGVILWFGNRNMPTGRMGVSPQRLLVLRYR